MAEVVNITRVLPGDTAPTVIFSDAPIAWEGETMVVAMDQPPVQAGDLLESGVDVLEVTAVEDHNDGAVVQVEEQP